MYRLLLVLSADVQVNDVLNKATNQAGKLVKKSLKMSNNINQMVSAGSKGNDINLCQIIACVGQQNVTGKRIMSVSSCAAHAWASLEKRAVIAGTASATARSRTSTRRTWGQRRAAS